MTSMRRAFVTCFWKCLISFKIYGDGKKYICFVRYGVCEILEKYVYIYIHIYIIFFFFEECVCKIYGSMRDMEIKCSKYMSL